MAEVQFHEYDSPTPLLPLLKSSLPTTTPIYQRIQSPQNVPERCTLLLGSVPPASVPQCWDKPFSLSNTHITIGFVDRSRPHESLTWLFNTLCLEATRPEQLSPEMHQLIIAHLRGLLYKIKAVGDGYITKSIKPLNYPFSPILRMAALHELLGTTIV